MVMCGQSIGRTNERQKVKTKRMVQIVVWEGKKYLVPFNLDLEIDKGKVVEVRNRFGGGRCALPWFAVAVYDMVIGAEMMQSWEDQRQGLDWFIKYFPNEYMVLLD